MKNLSFKKGTVIEVREQSDVRGGGGGGSAVPGGVISSSKSVYTVHTQKIRIKWDDEKEEFHITPLEFSVGDRITFFFRNGKWISTSNGNTEMFLRIKPIPNIIFEMIFWVLLFGGIGGFIYYTGLEDVYINRHERQGGMIISLFVIFCSSFAFVAKIVAARIGRAKVENFIKENR